MAPITRANTGGGGMAAIIMCGPNGRAGARPRRVISARRPAAVAAASAAAAVAVSGAGPAAMAAAAAAMLLVAAATARPARPEVGVADLVELEQIVMDLRAELDARTSDGIDRIDRVTSIVADIRDQIR